MNLIRVNTLRNMSLTMMISSIALSYSLNNYSLNKLFYIIGIILIIPTVRKIKFTLYQVIYFFITTGLFLIYLVGNDRFKMTETYFLYFLLFFSYTIVITSERIDFESLYRYLSVCLIFCIPSIIYSFKNQNDVGNILGISYAILPLYFSGIVVLKDSKILKSLFFKIYIYLITILYSYFYISIANRGALLCTIIFVSILLLFQKYKNVKNRLKVFSFLVVIVSLVFLNLRKILEIVNRLLLLFNIKVTAIEKSMVLINDGENLDSGRMFIIDKTLSTISSLSNLLFGKKIGFIENEIGTYTHNFIIQFLIEGGIVYLLLLFIFLYYFFKHFFIKNDNLIYIFLLTSSLLPLMLSNVYWLNPLFWFSINYTMINREKINTFSITIKKE